MNRDSFAIPFAIVVAAALIAGAIYFNNDGAPAENANSGGTDQKQEAAAQETTLRAIDDADHIRGNPNAEIMLVEYSDFDCPFCKQFHETMNQIMDEYGESGKVAWAYRQFPLEQLHPNAPKIAEASECVAELGGNDAFWAFADLIFGERETNEQTDVTKLPTFAEKVGVNPSDLETCLNEGRYTEKVAASIKEVIAAGGRGTPHTIVVVGDQNGVINGAQPYGVVKQIIDNLLVQLENDPQQ